MTDPTVLTPEELELKRATTIAQLRLAEQVADPTLIAKVAARWVADLIDLATPLLVLIPPEPAGYLRAARAGLGTFLAGSR